MSAFKPWSMAEYERHKDIKPMELSNKNERFCTNYNKYKFIDIGNNEKAKGINKPKEKNNSCRNPKEENGVYRKNNNSDDINIISPMVDLFLEVTTGLYLIAKAPFYIISEVITRF